MTDHQIPLKANRVLNIILIGLLLILIRVWYLAVIQYEDHLQLSRKPQRRTVIEHVERATIRDRFNIPLALNRLQYNAAVCYAQIRQIPSISWKKDPSGKTVRVQERAEYIKKLSNLLAKELELDPMRIEDTIHAKASLFPHTPFFLKEDISEECYFRLRMLEKDWQGLHTQRTYKRFYPQGKTAGDIIGYMGAISQNEYLQIAQELKELQQYVEARESGETPFLPKGFNNPIEARARLKELLEKAYTINDLVGKSGIEALFDQELRGFYGKKTYEVDVKGNFLRELPGTKKMVNGRRVLLSISSELQEYAENLLTQNESFRDLKNKDGSCRLDAPWIKGGAIVVMDPKSGEILTMASHPRFDPNDFVPERDPEIKRRKQASLLRWLETDDYIGEIWDGKKLLERERYFPTEKKYGDEAIALSWGHYLDMILPSGSVIRAALERVADIRTAVSIQKGFERLLELSEQKSADHLLQTLYPGGNSLSNKSSLPSNDKKIIAATLNQYAPESSRIQTELNFFLESIPFNEDKLLVIDLCRIAAASSLFSEELLLAIGNQSLHAYRDHCQGTMALKNILRAEMQELYHDVDFADWRNLHFKTFLKEKRKEEKDKKIYPRPYTDYLDALEKELFNAFWNAHSWEFLEAFIMGPKVRISSIEPALQPYYAHLLDLHQGAAVHDAHLILLKNTLSALPADLRASYLKTMRSFQELNRPLLGQYRNLRNIKGKVLEKHLASAFYPVSSFGYGRSQAYRQSSPQGSIFKIVTAYEGLMQRYHQIEGRIKNLEQLNPLTLIDDLKGDARTNTNQQILGFDLEGQPITRLYKGGWLPRSSHGNIGKIDILGALEQSSNIYFAILAGDHFQEPSALLKSAKQFGFGERTGIELPGEISGNVPDDILQNRTGLYSFSIGQHSLVVTPLQTAVMLSAIANGGKILKPKLIQIVAGKEPDREDEVLLSTEYPFKEDLYRIGITFPLFTEALTDLQKSYVFSSPTEIKRTLFLPDEIRYLLMEGMHRAVAGPKGTARLGAVKTLESNPEGVKDYADIHQQLIGKTGTAQILYKGTVDAESKAEMKNHVWFTGISFSPDKNSSEQDPWSEPELVVVVYLKYGFRGGKEPAPLAAQIVKKWREICKKHGRTSYP